MSGDLLLQISEEDADAERLATLAGYLRAELLELAVNDVVALRSDEVPAGARAAGASAAGALLVALGQSAAGLSSLLSVVRDWLRRGEETTRSVRLELDGDALELSAASAADQERLIELFVSKHAMRQGRQ